MGTLTRPTLAERWFAFRNAKLADPRFQRWAASFPPTRRIAARRAKDLFDLSAGFVYAQVLFTCVELKLFEVLRAGPLASDVLASRMDLPASALSTLLTAAHALRLVERRPGDAYGLGVHGAAFLGNPAIEAMIRHHALLYRDLENPVALLRGDKSDTALAAFWPYAGSSGPDHQDAAIAPYSDIMGATQALIADDILDAVPLSGHRRVLDVGGGDGTFLLAAAKRHADWDLLLFELPAVLERARARFAQARLPNPVELIAGDFRHDALPSGLDLVSLVRVAHDHDETTVAALLAKVFNALLPGGTLLLAEPLAETSGAESVGAYFAFYLMAMRQGCPRRFADLQRLLYGAGFARVRRVRTARPLFTSLIVAQKSAGPANRYVNLN